jgi:hypothetical protein
MLQCLMVWILNDSKSECDEGLVTNAALFRGTVFWEVMHYDSSYLMEVSIHLQIAINGLRGSGGTFIK